MSKATDLPEWERELLERQAEGGHTCPAPPPLSLVFTGRAPEWPDVEAAPVAYLYRGQPADVSCFDLVERAVLRALCADIIASIDGEVSR